MENKIFSNINCNIEILEGCYRKLKSYYYYNKNLIIIKKKISDFECDEEEMNRSFTILANYLRKPNQYETYINSLCDKISFYVLPKKFENKKNDETVISNEFYEKKLISVNYFINLPIELMILDVLWTLLIEKNALEDEEYCQAKNYLYGNILHESLFFSNEINFQTRRFIMPYFQNYLDWRNGAFDKMDEIFKKSNSQSTVLFSLDIKKFFYSIRINKKEFDEYIQVEKNGLQFLSNLFFNIYACYFDKLSKQTDSTYVDLEGFALPIGMFSSREIANLYLKKYDNEVLRSSGLEYYGRYVDDMLLVYKTEDDNNKSDIDWINTILVNNNLLEKKSSDSYCLKNFPKLEIQAEKVKVIYINSKGSRFLLDYYNENFKAIPSSFYEWPLDINLDEFNKNAFSFGKFKQIPKPQELENIQINSLFLSIFFSKLCRKYSRVHETNDQPIEKIINKINRFFEGNSIIEHINLWQSYFYFLLFVKRTEVKHFFLKVRNQIDRIHYEECEKIESNLKETLQEFLNVCLLQTISLDYSMIEWYPELEKYKDDVQKFIKSNLFNHSLIPLPLSNFFNYKDTPSYKNLTLDTFFANTECSASFFSTFNKKLKWNPRFLHYHEIQIFIFYTKLGSSEFADFYKDYDEIASFYKKINFMSGGSSIGWSYSKEEIHINSNLYQIDRISISSASDFPPKIMFIVGNAKSEESSVLPYIKDSRPPKEKSNDFFCSSARFSDLKKIFREASRYKRFDMPKLLVLSELYLPFHWIMWVLDFVKENNIAVVTGLQYIKDSKGRHRNLILSAYPYYHNDFSGAFFFYREKNDYSPDEKRYFKENGETIYDVKNPKYQIINWNGLDISSMICYELTDISARAIMKGQCDILTASVFNKDTTYFSNIIESTVRDLHVCIVQTNTSKYGDSRVSLPFDRDNRDLIKVKGGINANAIIEILNFSKIANYQQQYDPYEKGSESVVKKPSARFKNKRTKPPLQEEK